MFKALCGSRGSWVKFDKLPQVVFSWGKDYKFENEKNVGEWCKKN